MEEDQGEGGAVGGISGEGSSDTLVPTVNLILTEGNTWLSDEEKLVMLRMNRKFNSFMRKHYPNAVGEVVPSMGTVLTEAQNEEVEEVEVMEAVEIEM